VTQLPSIAFPTGVTVHEPLERLSRFLTAEYNWYDGYDDASPNTIEPFDVLVAAGLNAFVGTGVEAMRTVQGGMAEVCNQVLTSFPVNDDLKGRGDFSDLVEIILASTYVRFALSARVTKILHRKRRELVPILDTVMVKQYCSDKEARVLADSYASQAHVRGALHSVVGAVQADIVACWNELVSLSNELKRRNWNISPLRVHDILVWTEKEDRGYYR